MRLEVTAVIYMCVMLAIWAQEEEESYYDFLGVKNDARASEIKNAYYRLARNLHPDRGGNVEDFQKLQSIYETLSTERLRRDYDETSKKQKGSTPRSKRNGVATMWALSNGIIGSTVTEMMKLNGNRPPAPTRGTCMWEGAGPACAGTCPHDFDFIRRSTGKHCFPDPKCAHYNMFMRLLAPCGQVCVEVDPKFGSPCRGGTQKSYCCKEDRQDNTWSGRWTRAETGDVMRCRFQKTGVPHVIETLDTCGSILCRENGIQEASNITGVFCDEFTLFGDSASAVAGLITFNSRGTYYKTNS